MRIKLLIILFFFSLIIKAGYDSCYVIAVNQDFFILEGVADDDYVEYWLQNVTYKCGSASFAIKTNHNNAFAINSSTGLITIADYTQINGKIVQQDTIINIVITSTVGTNSEDDTAFIHVKEASYCILDDTTGINDGSHEGYGFFFERGSNIEEFNIPINYHLASAAHPTVISAYGQGNKPNFNGIEDDDHFIRTGDYSENIDGRVEYVYVSSLDIHNYRYAAFKSVRTSNNNWLINSYIHNCDRYATEASVIVNTGDYADTTLNYYFKIQNCVFDTVGYQNDELGNGVDDGDENTHIKGMGIEIINCTFISNGLITDYSPTIMFNAGHNSTLKHCLFEESNTEDALYALQLRSDSTLVEDCIFTNASNSADIFIADPGGDPGMCPDSVVLSNVKINSKANYAIYITKTTEYDPSDDVYIEDFDISGATDVGIYVRGAKTMKIRRGIIDCDTNSIYMVDTGIDDVELSYLVCYGASGQELRLAGDNIHLYNLTVDGVIDLDQCTNDSTRYSFWIELRNNTYDYDNIDIDDIVTGDYFTDYASNDYSLLSTAELAIDDGEDWGQEQDIDGNSRYGDVWDIGAYEYQEGAEQNSIIFKKNASRVYFRQGGKGVYNKK